MKNVVFEMLKKYEYIVIEHNDNKFYATPCVVDEDELGKCWQTIDSETQFIDNRESDIDNSIIALLLHSDGNGRIIEKFVVEYTGRGYIKH